MASMDFEMRFGRSSSTPAEDEPLKLLVLADLSGRANRNVNDSLAGRKPLPVDVDNFDTVFSQLSPSLSFDLGGEVVSLKFSEEDDFHPDALYDKLPLFQAVRKTRKQLLDSSTFAAAAQQFRPSAPAEKTSEESQGDVLARLLGRSTNPHASPAAGAVERLLEQVVAPYMVPEKDPRQDQLIASVDEATAALMRALLHHPDFQHLEANWLAVRKLVSNLETGEELRIAVLDCTQTEVAESLKNGAANSPLAELLAGPAVGQKPWSVLLTDFTFSASEESVAQLKALGELASGVGAPVLAGACPSVFGCSDLVQSREAKGWKIEEEGAKRWNELRGLPQAKWIGLACPRILMRLPYGAKTDKIERFQFEEMQSRNHEAYLWGPAGIACGLLVGQTFQEEGWSMSLGRQDFTDLPAHIYEEEGEKKLQPCAEVLWSEQTTEAVLDCGIMPLASYKNQNQVKLMRWQSLASPPAPLSGRWEK